MHHRQRRAKFCRTMDPFHLLLHWNQHFASASRASSWQVRKKWKNQLLLRSGERTVRFPLYCGIGNEWQGTGSMECCLRPTRNRVSVFANVHALERIFDGQWKGFLAKADQSRAGSCLGQKYHNNSYFFVFVPSWHVETPLTSAKRGQLVA